VLTAEKGVIDILVRGGQKSVKNSASTQLFSYSSLCLDEKKNPGGQTQYYLNSS
jgi:DNA repair protein RecO (recombination protein O)